MLKKNISVIGIKNGKLIAAKVSGKKVTKSKQYNWDLNTFDLSFAKAVRENKIKRARVLIGSDLSYVLRLKIPLGIDAAEERSYIATKISEEIPETLTDSDWDFKELHFDVEKSGKSEKEVIVFAPVKGLYSALSDAARKLKVEIEVIEPEVVAAVRHENPLVGVALKKDVSGKDIDSLNLKPSDISRAREETDKSQEDNTLLIDKAKKLKEENIESVVEQSYDGNEIEIPKEEKKGKVMPIIIVFLIVAAIAGLGIFLYKRGIIGKDMFTKSDQVAEQQEITPTPEPTTTEEETSPTPTEAEIDLSALLVQIQNGSGIAGEADFAAELLAAEGFTQIDTANADSFENSTTSASLKTGLSSQIYDVIERALNSDYEVARGDDLEKSSDYDVVVVVGERL